jgi:dTMP kinase
MIPLTQPRAQFITFEGIDGAGKSSHVEAVQQLIASRGIEVVCTREPGGTAAGEAIREIFLHHSMSPHTEALLVFAARREHLEHVVWPALARGAWVLCDRFTDATFAYQGGGRELGDAHITALAKLVHPDFSPDLTLLFDLSPDQALERVANRGVTDRIESEAKDFHHRVRHAYLKHAAAEPNRIHVFDTRKPKPEISAQVIVAVASFIDRWRKGAEHFDVVMSTKVSR